MKTGPSLSVVLPAFNEAQNLAATVAGALAVLPQLSARFEVLIVDDGSRDGTAEVCRDLTSRNGGVHVLRHSRNRGYGGALRTGFKAARGELIFFTDADGQFAFDQLSRFLADIENIDMVIGYRERRQDAWHRTFNSRLGNSMARRLLHVRARDINCAYKLMRRDLLMRLPLRSDGALISAELLALARRARWQIKERPVLHFSRKSGNATGANPLVILRTIQEYFQLRGRLNDASLLREIGPAFATSANPG